MATFGYLNAANLKSIETGIKLLLAIVDVIALVF